MNIRPLRKWIQLLGPGYCVHAVDAHQGWGKPGEHLLCFRHNTRAPPPNNSILCMRISQNSSFNPEPGFNSRFVSHKGVFHRLERESGSKGCGAGSSPVTPTPGQTLRPQSLSTGMDSRLWQPMKGSPLLQSLPQFLYLPYCPFLPFPKSAIVAKAPQQALLAGEPQKCQGWNDKYVPPPWFFAWVLEFELRTSHLSLLSRF